MSSRSTGTFETLEPRRLLASVAYDFNATAQAIDAIGGNYAKAPFHDTANDAIGEYTLEHLKPGVVRVPVLLSQWEPANDNADPGASNAAAFDDSGEVHDLFLMMQEYEQRGLEISAAIFNAPDWMVSNPGNINQRIVPQQNWPELIESIRTFLQHAKDVYGVTVDTISFNEPNGGFKLLFGAQDLADFIETAGPSLAGAGVYPRWLVGDTYQVKNTVDYARTILNDAGARPYLGPIAFHTWWSESIPESTWREIKDLAREFNKNVWASEVGYDATAWTSTPWIFPTWQNAERLAVTYHKSLAWAQSNVALYWQYQDDFPLMSADTSTQYYAYHVVKQLADNLPAGSRIVRADSDTASVFALAAKHAGDGTFMSQLINTSGSDQTTTLTGLPNAPITILRTSSDGEKSVNAGTFTPVAGQLTLTLKGDSVNILKGSFAAAGTRQPWSGTPITIGNAPVTIQAELFDKGGEGVAYHDTDTTNGGATSFRSGEGVDLKTISGSNYRVNNTFAGEWMTYSVNVQTAGEYDVTFRVGGKGSNGMFHLDRLSGATPIALMSPAAVPNTGSNDAWTTITRRVNLPAGQYALRLAFDQNSTYGSIGNFDHMTIAPVSVTPPPGDTTTIATDTATYVRGGSSADTNFGSSTDLVVKTSPSGSAGNIRETYLKVDLGSVDNISSAKLQLTGRLNTGGSLGIDVFSTTNTGWTENGLTWNNKPVATASRGSFTMNGTSNAIYELNLTSFLQAEFAAGRKLVTLVLKANPSDTQALFTSDETATGPRLLIT